MKQLAIIDDDPEILKLLDQYLTKNGFEVEAFTDGESFLKKDVNKFSLIVLDIGLPGIDGLEVCKRVRQNSNIPIIMLTAASDDLDRILGLELGSDDYMGKPFNPRELLARIKALLRRSEIKEEDVDNNIVMNYAARSAFIGGEELELTGTEFDLLCVFHKQIGTVLSRDEIGELLHGRKVDPLDRSIDTIVSRLRHKLSSHFDGEIIQSVRGKGYVLLLKS
ncbi:response regulator transcription factor [Candidatus Pseudothioglobus singularis]|jgi:DNA-binding response OmpR family regulator|nr:response regulator transcription factor [Candidatus Pseudothioglobus singularis]MDA7440785.1 response regulator transcription factor [Candidatus Pseudothioglobus singularis]MDB4598356.1 response regulator transcription factor [Candidatus Pseudothioglobus singularis]MDB4847055.1 response regulator transcription factor [Candidatus Pseudothioglobus singularis]MDC0470376.1 response regulator transcription factor [Candidatus Pseudothioglobus singularis]